MDVTLRELIYDEQFAGGIRDGRALKCVIPGGSSVPVLLPDQLDIPASFDGIAEGRLAARLGRHHRAWTTRRAWCGRRRTCCTSTATSRAASARRAARAATGCTSILQQDRARRRADARPRPAAVASANNIARQDAVRVRRRGGDARAVDDQDVPRASTRRTSARAAARCRPPGARARRAARRTDACRSASRAQLIAHLVRHRGRCSSRCRSRRPCSSTWSARSRRSSSSAYGPYLVGPQGPAAAARRHPQADLQGGAAAEGGRHDPLLRWRRSSRRRRRSRPSPSCRSAPTRRSSACSIEPIHLRWPTSTSACS